ncbi:type III-B CRISPR module RAMP protein Cmr6 [Rapidithrix thailandica]|uniref:Type III-B CRISPR module RAMP protein Cmr6 n=1 Tax=Rapidithrix thailandica TaxID=413964 RepID=A0AAW9S8A9_9BACT
MEKGTLKINATKKGFAGIIQFTKPNGKGGQLPVSVYKFQDGSLNGKECEFERNGGTLMKLVVDGKTLYPTEQVRSPKTGSQNRTWENNRQTSIVQIDDSLNISKTFLPKDTQEIFSLAEKEEIANFALKFHKAARYDEKRGVFTFFKRERKGENFQLKADFSGFPFAEIARQHRKNAKINKKESDFFETELVIDWRLALGLGIDNVYETGITLHHIYGIPYIPASAIKGVVRSWIITHYFGEHGVPDLEKKYPFHNAEYRAYQDKNFCHWFGCPSDCDKILFTADGNPLYKNKAKNEYKTEKKKTALKEENQGKVIFFDAFSTSAPTIEPDVMNPHYQPYYSESANNAKTPPADYHNPVPVFFLTVTGCSFQFMVAARTDADGKNPLELGIGKKDKDKNVEEWLKEALTNHGIGAKTAVGYGYMNSTEQA